MNYQDRKKYYLSCNNRLREGRAIARKLDALRSQYLVAEMLGMTRGLVDKVEAQALYKLKFRLNELANQ